MGSSAKSIASEKSNESMSAKIRAAKMAKKRIEGVLEKKMRLASMLNRRAFLRRFGSSMSMEATLDSMEMELSSFEKAIGREILGPSADGKLPFSFDLAARKGSDQNKKTAGEKESRNLHADEGENQETLSVQSKSNETLGSTHGNQSVTTRKASNLVSSNRVYSLPEVDENDESDHSGYSDSDSSVSDDEESAVAPQIEYKESNVDINTSGPFRWYDRFVREGDFCIDYACRVIECDPTATYANAQLAVAGFTHLEGTGEVEPEEVQAKEEKLEEEKPKKRKSWFRGVPGLNKKGATTIELKNADAALEDLTDSDSWSSEEEIAVIDKSKLLSSSPEEYFATIGAAGASRRKKKSSNRAGDKDKEEVSRIERAGRVMCEV
ncbi:unnamed protein product [Cylindrotheca closterium]|uniref:Uncharacterized protein n=1 Tax=Cylindrotheca closterium TaxID=2856 RepID=A0AAD2G6T5_9STRA|nr:unnamed protein product [Cylindrotheca closterium]